jgi:hypothetical protein
MCWICRRSESEVVDTKQYAHYEQMKKGIMKRENHHMIRPMGTMSFYESVHRGEVVPVCIVCKGLLDTAARIQMGDHERKKHDNIL